MIEKREQTKIDSKISDDGQVKMEIAQDLHWDMYVVNWYDLKHHGKGFEKNEDKTFETMCTDEEGKQDVEDTFIAQMHKYNMAHPVEADDDGPFYAEIEDVNSRLSDLANELESYGEYSSAENILKEIESLAKDSMLDIPVEAYRLKKAIDKRKEKAAASRIRKQIEKKVRSK